MSGIRYCSVPECGRPHRARGLCGTHYRRWHKHGSPHVKLKNHGELLKWLADHAADIGEDCLTWPFGRNAGGYGEVSFEGRQQLASRVMCELAHGAPRDTGTQAAHSCGRGHLGCVRPNHLRWATREENASDKKLHGTDGRGEKNAFAKLSDQEADAIRRLACAPKANQRRIAAVYGITQATVSDIKRGRRRGWQLPGPAIEQEQSK